MIFFFNHDKWDVIAVLMVYASQLVVFIYNHSGGDNFGVSSCRWTLSWQRANNNNLPEFGNSVYPREYEPVLHTAYLLQTFSITDKQNISIIKFTI